jgi:hypothetical protein
MVVIGAGLDDDPEPGCLDVYSHDERPLGVVCTGERGVEDIGG